MGNVWEVIHHAYRPMSDVAVAKQRSDDPDEWRQAHYGALRNMHEHEREYQRWSRIADEMVEGLAKATNARDAATVARLEAEDASRP